jgi:hypothetical protein
VQTVRAVHSDEAVRCIAVVIQGAETCPGHELKIHLAATGCGGATEPCTKLVRAFQLEAAALQGRTDNAREEEALSAYKEAAEAYAFFARLRSLEVQEVVSGGSGEELLLLDEASGKRFNIPLKSKGSTSTMWAETGEALRIAHAYAEQRFAEAERIVTGEAR